MGSAPVSTSPAATAMAMALGLAHRAFRLARSSVQGRRLVRQAHTWITRRRPMGRAMVFLARRATPSATAAPRRSPAAVEMAATVGTTATTGIILRRRRGTAMAASFTTETRRSSSTRVRSTSLPQLCREAGRRSRRSSSPSCWWQPARLRRRIRRTSRAAPSSLAPAPANQRVRATAQTATCRRAIHARRATAIRAAAITATTGTRAT